MFSVRYPNASKLKQVIHALSKISDELQLEVTLESLQLKALAPDKTMMASLVLPSIVFEEYSVEEETKVLVPASELKKVIKRATRNDVAHISLSKEASELSVILRDKKTGLEREFAAPLIPRPPEPLPELDVELSVSFSMLSQDFKNIVGDVKLVGDEVELSLANGKITIKSAEQSKEYVCELSEGNPLTFLSSIASSAKATYSTDMLITVARAAGASKQVLISFDTGKPMKIEYELAGGGKLVYWIVPRM